MVSGNTNILLLCCILVYTSSMLLGVYGSDCWSNTIFDPVSVTFNGTNINGDTIVEIGFRHKLIFNSSMPTLQTFSSLSWPNLTILINSTKYDFGDVVTPTKSICKLTIEGRTLDIYCINKIETSTSSSSSLSTSDSEITYLPFTTGTNSGDSTTSTTESVTTTSTTSNSEITTGSTDSMTSGPSTTDSTSTSSTTSGVSTTSTTGSTTNFITTTSISTGTEPTTSTPTFTTNRITTTTSVPTTSTTTSIPTTTTGTSDHTTIVSDTTGASISSTTSTTGSSQTSTTSTSTTSISSSHNPESSEHNPSTSTSDESSESSDTSNTTTGTPLHQIKDVGNTSKDPTTKEKLTKSLPVIGAVVGVALLSGLVYKVNQLRKSRSINQNLNRYLADHQAPMRGFSTVGLREHNITQDV